MALAVALPTIAWAHDFWLVPMVFDLPPGGMLEVRGQTSSAFPTSESAVAVDRVASARLLSATEDVVIRDLSTSGTSLVLRHRPGTPGQYIVAAILKPRSVRESAASFRRYLELEGAPEAAARYEREGRLPTRDSVTRRYAKYAKALVRVGRGGAAAHTRIVGHPLEFVPLDDPFALVAGDSLRVRLLYDGRPLAGVRIHAEAAPVTGAVAPHVSLATDAQGVAVVPIARGGLWNVRAIHVVPATARSGADWDAHWASFVFTTAASGTAGDAAGASAPGVRTDSALATQVVRDFHAALETGDSVAALALLAPDAVVLESGGIESRAEYRAHHLSGDIEFARGVPATRGAIRITVIGAAAWASSTTVSTGTFRGRAINSAGAELMVLARDADGQWRIRAVHWSSQNRRTAPR